MMLACIILLLTAISLFAQPQVQVEPDEIDGDWLFTGEVAEYELTVSNVGDETLEFEILHEFNWDEQRAPRRDDAGDLLGQFQGINRANELSSCLGWDPVNEWMWVSNFSNGTVAAFSHNGNYEDFEERVRLRRGRGNFGHGTFANGMLYAGNIHATVSLWNADGERIRDIQFPYRVCGLGSDEENGWLFVMNSENRNIHVYEFDDEGGVGDQLGIIDNHCQYHGNVNVYGLEWVEQHPNGQLWMTNGRGNRVFQIAVDTDEWTAVETVQSFNVGRLGQPYCEVAHDGMNLWVSGSTADDIRIYDDGIVEYQRQWLQYEPEAGEVEPDEETIVTVTIDAHGLRGGDYEAELHILSNDPQNDEIVVDVFFIVDNPPVLMFPEEMLFPDTYITRTSLESFILENPFDDAFSIDEIEVADEENFSLLTDAEDGITLEPGEEIEIEFAFHPQDEDEFETTATFAVDILEEGEAVLPLIGRGLLPPEPPWELGQEGEEAHSILVNDVTFEGEDIDAWYVGLFVSPDPDVQICSNFSLWRGERIGLNGYLDEDWVGDGDHLFNFRLWDPFAEVEYRDVEIDFIDGPEVWQRDALTIVELNARRDDPPPQIVIELDGLDDNEWFVLQGREDDEFIEDYPMSIGNEGDEDADELNWSITFDDVEGEEGGDPNEWISVDPEEGQIAPGDAEEVTITINTRDLEPEEEYYAYMNIDSNDPENEQLEILVHLFVLGPEPFMVWELSPESDRNHSVIIAAITFQDEEMEGWYVGAFDNRDSNIAVDFAEWEGDDIGLALWGDDPDTEEDEGYNAGQALDFRLYDPEADVEYMGGIVQVNYVQGPREWTRDALTIISSVNVRGDIIEFRMRAGWNLFSINVHPGEEYYDPDEDRGPDIVRMFADLQYDEEPHHVQLLKDEHGRFWVPEINFLNIPYWEVTQGYWIMLDETVSIGWTGAPIAFNADIPIEEGWNIIAYFPDYNLPMDVVDRNDPENPHNFYAIRTIIDQVIIMKNKRGQFAVPDRMFSNMNNLRTGQGYKIKMDEDVVLNYPEPFPEDQVATSETEKPAELIFLTAPTPTRDNMSLLVMSENPPLVPPYYRRGKNDGFTPPYGRGGKSHEGVEIGVYAGDRLVGAGRIDGCRCGIAVWGDDPTTDEVDGAIEDDPLEIRVIGDEGAISARVTTIDGKPNYRTDALWVVKLDESAMIPDEFRLASIYPNPFNSQTRISYHLPTEAHLDLALYDISGREVTTLFSGVRPAGVWSAIVNGSDLASGVYFVRLQASDQAFTQKVMLIR